MNKKGSIIAGVISTSIIAGIIISSAAHNISKGEKQLNDKPVDSSFDEENTIKTTAVETLNNIYGTNLVAVPQDLSNIDECYEKVLVDFETNEEMPEYKIKRYKKDRVLITIDREKNIVEYFLMNSKKDGSKQIFELYFYDELVAYADGVDNYNWDFFKNLQKSTEVIKLENASDYIDGFEDKDCYTMDEIYTYMQKIAESVKTK